MEAGPTPPPPGDPRLPAVRSAAPRGAGPHRLRRLTRTRRGAAGLVVVAAALLLWPFAGWFWIPWLAGLAAVVLIALLRLDRVLDGWTWHVGGLVVLVGMMLRTGPWDWALAASLGVLVAGLLQLPWWRLAAVGAVLCVLAGAGWGWERHRDAQAEAGQEAQTSAQNRGQLGVARPNLVLQVLLGSVGRGDVGPVCGNLLSEPAKASFAAAVGAPDCAAAVQVLAREVADPGAYARGRAPTTGSGDGTVVDACRLTWPSGVVPGPQLGVLTVGREATGTTYVVEALTPCAPP